MWGTELKFFVNQKELESAMIHKLLIDYPDYLHFIGGIRHHNKVFSPFRGFMFAFSIINSYATSIYTDLFSPTACGNSCEVCNDTGWGNQCLSDCEINQFETEGGNCVDCRADCLRGCVRGTDCDLCDSSCEKCEGFGTTGCLP
jgi:hypothetical protein